jgi:hypothetical protein
MKQCPAETRILLALVLLLAALFGGRANAYTLLTHEELIDLNWQKSIVPLLLSRYPNLTPAQLEEARAYAYGGCVIQDMGYYPFGDKAFSNLTHYVRSGDFVMSLFRNAHNADELAFAWARCLITWATRSATPKRPISVSPWSSPGCARNTVAR